MLEEYTAVEKDYPLGNPNMPFGYLAGLVSWVGRNTKEWNVFSYKDMKINPHQNDIELLNEFKDWHSAHIKDKNKHLLFQYDVDARPDVTEALIRVHLEAGVPANVMIFNQRIWDGEFKKTGKIKIDDSYQIDFGLLREFSESGGVVGYHCNVWERSLFDLNKSKNLFLNDIDTLRSEVDIEYFSMHGGPTDKKGRSNSHIIELKEFAADQDLTWVHNGRSPSFHKMWDDGGAGHPNYRYRMADVSEALAYMNNGNRARLLFHPQYYRCTNASQINNKNQQDMYWFEEMVDKFDNRVIKETTIWKKILSNFKKPLSESPITTPEFFSSQYWGARLQKVNTQDGLIQDCVSSVESNYLDSPIFVNGMSRSGTTLMNALLDVHPDISMSYELYPNYLTGHGDVIEKYIDYTAVAYLLRNTSSDGAYKIIQEAGYDDFIRYMACAGHSRLTTRDVGDLLFMYLKKYNSIYTYEDALKFVGACAKLKMKRLTKKTWGAKSQGRFEKYTNVWPNARFVYMLRDGRDILASQLNTGSFNPNVEKVAKGWVSNIKRFEEKMKNAEINGFIMKYEDLALHTENKLHELCDNFDISFHRNMINHSEHDISLLDEPRGQLSAEQVSKPIDTSSIGRWRSDLSVDQIEIFNSIAGEELTKWGYEVK